MDQAASTLGISRSRVVVFIDEIPQALSKIAARYVTIPTLEELKAVEDRRVLARRCYMPSTALTPTPRPRAFEGRYCLKNFPAENVRAVVDHIGAFCTISIRARFNKDQSLWNGSAVKNGEFVFVLCIGIIWIIIVCVI